MNRRREQGERVGSSHRSTRVAQGSLPLRAGEMPAHTRRPALLHVAPLRDSRPAPDLAFGRGYDAVGCTVNRIGAQELFTRYEACGFLYGAKLARLRPHLALIADNWRRSMSGPDPIHHAIVY